MNYLNNSFQQKFATLCLLLLFPILVSAQDLKVTVVGVIDGDNITVMTKDKSQKQVRLIGIDAPEKEQSFGDVARQYLSSLILNKSIVIRNHKVNAEGQILGKVLLGSNDVGLEMIRAGLAWYYKDNDEGLSIAEKSDYVSSETEAKQQSKGLWREQAPQSPWAFRERPPSVVPNQIPTSTFGGTIFTASVAEIISNNSIAVRKSDSSRIAVCISNIETPEQGQPFADVARQHLQDLLLNKNVTINLKGFSEEDACLMADIYLGNININLQMVRDGVAWSNKDYYYPEGYYIYAEAEQAARNERRGLWQDPSPTPPWVYRGDDTAFNSVETGGSGYGSVIRGYSTGSGGSKAGTDVRVRGYYRSDGTYVRSYTRSAPGRGSGGSRSGSSGGRRGRN